MTIVPLSNQEKAALGYTHQIHLSVLDGDLDTAETLDAIALEAEDLVEGALLDISTAWAGGTTETISVGLAATGTSATDFINAQALTSAATVFTTNNEIALASEFVTITRGGSGTSTAGEAWLYLKITRPSEYRNTA